MVLCAKTRVSAGFTLIELAAVVVILAAVVMVGWPRWVEYHSATQQAAMAGTFKTVIKATWDYRLDNNRALPFGRVYTNELPAPLRARVDEGAFSVLSMSGSWRWSYDLSRATPWFGFEFASGGAAGHEALCAGVDQMVDDGDVTTGRMTAEGVWLRYDFDANGAP